MTKTTTTSTRNGYYIGTVLSPPREAKRTIEIANHSRPEMMALFGRLVGETMESDAENEKHALRVKVTHMSTDIENRIKSLEGRLGSIDSDGPFALEELDRLRASRLSLDQEVLLHYGIPLPMEGSVAFKIEDVIATLTEPA